MNASGDPRPAHASVPGPAAGPAAPGFDRRAVARAFTRAATRYDAAATLQARTRAELLARLQYFRIQPQVVLDLGAGTGQGSAALCRRYGSAQVLAADLAPGMLRAAVRPRWPWRLFGRRFGRLAADAAALPLRDHSVDLVFSHLMLQWCDDPQTVFGEIQRVLKPGGLLVFSTFGQDTLAELRAAWAQVDTLEHVSAFADMPGLGAAMLQAGLAEPVMDVEHHVLYYPDAPALMGELRAIGATHAGRGRRRSLTGRGRLQAMTAAYEHLRAAAGLPATYEIIFGAAFGGAAPAHASQGTAPGEYAVSLSQLGRRSRPP